MKTPDISPPPLTLYIHLPWCLKKCPYCDFNSHALRGDLNEEKYIQALLNDLDRDLKIYQNTRAVAAIFLGGGTPSLFTGKTLQKLLREISARVEFVNDIEITMEANPGALEYDDLGAYRAANINRLSLGVQSFNPEHLKILGRIHSASNARHALTAAKSEFDNFNIDLMFGLPQQTCEQAVQDLNTALEFAPTHLSLYQLTIEPNTWFAKHPPRLPNDAQTIRMQNALQQRATENNFTRYEISSYAQDKKSCRHNLNYWEFGDYLGIGAGAHGKITRADGSVIRYWKPKNPRDYMNKAADANNKNLSVSKEIPTREIIFEILLNGLRLTQGIPTALFIQNNCDVNAVLQLLNQAIQRDWVTHQGRRIKCTAAGYLFVDEILQQILPQ